MRRKTSPRSLQTASLPQPLIARFALARQLRQVLRVALGVATLAVASRLHIGWLGTAVPLTLQPTAVLAVAAVLGAREGTMAVASWLTMAALGAPVLAGPWAGPAALLGPTAGYLASYLPVAALVGGARGRGPWAVGASFAAGAGLTLACGALWLALGLRLGAAQAIAVGVRPFVLVDLTRAAAALVLLQGTLGTRRR